MIDAKRRTLLKGSVGIGAVGLAAGAGVLTPGVLLASWPEAAFKATDKTAALKDLLGSGTIEPSDAIDIKAPDIAENGAVVPVTVSTDLEGVKSITIVSPSNKMPLIATFELFDSAAPFVSTRIKMAETSEVMAVVQTQAGLFSAVKSVKVTVGGCGG